MILPPPSDLSQATLSLAAKINTVFLIGLLIFTELLHHKKSHKNGYLYLTIATLVVVLGYATMTYSRT